MQIVTLSGWGQAADALSGILPDAAVLDYAAYPSEAAFREAPMPPCDILVGWSLGGQLAINLIAENKIKPKTLVLFSTPFKFEDDQFNTFYQSCISNADQCLKRFRTMMAQGDNKGKEIMRSAQYSVGKHLPYWLTVLKNFDAGTIDFSHFPKTLIIHGEQDSIVSIQQAEQFARVIRGSALMTLKQCGHAPHLHDMQAVSAIFQRFSL